MLHRAYGYLMCLFVTTAIADVAVAHTTARLIQMSFNQQQNKFWWLTKVENQVAPPASLQWINQIRGGIDDNIDTARMFD